MFTNPDTEQAVIDRITYYRKLRGSTEVHLARAAGISTRTFSRYMRRDGMFTLRQLIAISETLGIRLSDLTANESQVQAVAA